MGVHHVNLARNSALVLDASVHAARPEFLLYFAGAGWGSQRLAAVEYGVPVFVDGLPYYGSAPPDPRAINPPPSPFGHRFDGPMPGHIAAQPWHYDLHVWLWSEKPGRHVRSVEFRVALSGQLHATHGVGRRRARVRVLG